MLFTVEHVGTGHSHKWNWDSMPVAYKDDIWEMRMVEIGNMILTQVRGSAGWDALETFKGLPDTMCQSPHYGVCISGRVVIHTKEGDIECGPGDMYYQAVPHRVEWLEDSVLIEFSPREEFLKTQEIIERNKGK